MDNAQFAALLGTVGAGLAGVAASIRWAVNRVVKSIDDQSSSNLRLADAQIELASAFATMRADIDSLMRWIVPRAPSTKTPTTANLHTIDDESDQREERPTSERRRSTGPARRTTTSGRGVPVLTEYPARRAHTDTQEDDDR